VLLLFINPLLSCVLARVHIIIVVLVIILLSHARTELGLTHVLSNTRIHTPKNQVVQHLKCPLVVKVYETHARISLESGDMASFGVCLARLSVLHSTLLGQQVCASLFVFRDKYRKNLRKRDVLSIESCATISTPHCAIFSHLSDFIVCASTLPRWIFARTLFYRLVRATSFSRTVFCTRWSEEHLPERS